MGSGKERVGAEARSWKNRTDVAGMANGAEESGCAGGENGALLSWGWGGRRRLISGVVWGFLMGARCPGRRVGWLVGFGDATHVGVGDLLGVDPR